MPSAARTRTARTGPTSAAAATIFAARPTDRSAAATRTPAAFLPASTRCSSRAAS